MKAVLQRVRRASVEIDGKTAGQIGAGFVILLGVHESDTESQAAFLAEKTAFLRVFEDDAGKMNRSILDVGGEALVISNFTLYADCRHGRRPAFVSAMKPLVADELYRLYVEKLREAGVLKVETGEFGAEMQVTLQNDGPVTIILDTDVLMKS